MVLFRYIFTCCLLLLAQENAAQSKSSLSGYVHYNNESLPGAIVHIKEIKISAETNAQGSFALSIPHGTYSMEVSLTGYKTFSATITLNQDTTININLEIETTQLKEVVISAERANANILRGEMSVEKLDIKQIKLMPALFGEVDIIKAIQMLPGVQSASEGSSGFSVRGGSPDQNLILFDDATVYNASHMMGFFSVFNNDAIQNITLFKGDIPATYGGRLSSLLEVNSREGENEFSGAAGIGLIASRIMAEGPIVRDKSSFIIAARRTYADMFLGLSSDQDLRDVQLYFYDLNAKIQGRINKNNFLSFTTYLGRDKYGGLDIGMNFGNKTATLKWRHLFSEKFFLHLEGLFSGYDYRMSANTPSLTGEWKSNISEYALRADFVRLLSDHSSIRFGYNSVLQKFHPGNARGFIEGESSEYTIDIAPQQAWENTLYFHNQHLLFDKWTVKYGMRYTRFDNIGATTNYSIDDDYNVITSEKIARGDFYNTYHGVEPRAGMVYAFSKALSVKMSYARTLQFLHLLSMSTAGSPLDVWIPSNPTIKPQSSQQWAAGVFSNFLNNRLESSVEIYYKKLNNVVDFKDHPQVLGNDIVETEIRRGKGENYGVEFMLKKNTGRLNGWLSYTYARAFRTIKEINNGNPYSAPFDRPNNINIVLSYSFTNRISASLNWVYSTGQPVTFPEARYSFGVDFIPVFTARNTYRMPDYHRMDASLNILLGKLSPNKKWKHELNVSIYNLYWRKNPWMINYKTDESFNQYAEMTYLFGIVPSITYNISFNK